MVLQAFVTIGMLLLAQIAGAQVNWRSSKLADSGTLGQPWDYDLTTYSLAISPDGNTVVVGGYGDAAARVFTRSNGEWSRQPDVPVASDAQPTVFPASVAISAEGTLIVGSPDDSSDVGAAWVYTRSGAVWTQQGPKLIGAGASGSAQEGYSVAISADGNTAIVGGPGDDRGAGAAWVFTRAGGVWTQQGPKLVGAGAAGSAKQGSSVALSADGDAVIVGGPFDSGGMTGGFGAAWTYARSGGVWAQQGSKLVGSGATGWADQGASVAISADGNTAIVGGFRDDYDFTDGSVGAAWVYTRSGGVWAQQGSKLVGADSTGKAQQGSVALSANGSTALVGGSWDGGGAGATWVYTRAGGVWTQQGPNLIGAGAAGNAGQGYAVALSADGRTFVAGGPGDGEGGAAWVFSNLAIAAWVPVASHNEGLNGGQWRSDLGLLNAGAAVANVQLQFFGSTGPVSSNVQVPAGAQSILTDVVGQLGAEGQGAIEIIADQPLKATTRTYNQSAPDAACFANGTHGQDFPVLGADGGLAAGESAYLPSLVQNASYRSNIGLVTTDAAGATVLVELFDGAGGKLAEYTVKLAQGQWAQENRPFEKKAGQTALSRGYAKVTVQSGAGVYAFASVIDNVTNDPTTVTMQR